VAEIVAGEGREEEGGRQTDDYVQRDPDTALPLCPRFRLFDPIFLYVIGVAVGETGKGMSKGEVDGDPAVGRESSERGESWAGQTVSGVVDWFVSTALDEQINVEVSVRQT
jgi:hypothetical protein